MILTAYLEMFHWRILTPAEATVGLRIILLAKVSPKKLMFTKHREAFKLIKIM